LISGLLFTVLHTLGNICGEDTAQRFHHWTQGWRYPFTGPPNGLLSAQRCLLI